MEEQAMTRNTRWEFLEIWKKFQKQRPRTGILAEVPIIKTRISIIYFQVLYEWIIINEFVCVLRCLTVLSLHASIYMFRHRLSLAAYGGIHLLFLSGFLGLCIPAILICISMYPADILAATMAFCMAALRRYACWSPSRYSLPRWAILW